MVLLEETIYEALLKTRKAQADQIALLKAEVEWYKQQFGLAQKRLYGPSSEKSPVGQEEMLFNEAEACASETLPDTATETITYTRNKKTKGRREQQLEGLPVEEINYELTDAELVCPNCGGRLHKIGVDTSQEITVYPARVVLTKHNQDKCSCRDCERNGIENPIVTAPMPVPAFKNSLASPSAVAYIMSQKYVEGLPLYRQEQNLRRLGFELSRKVMANWVIMGADLLEVLFRRMNTLLLERDIMAADETPIQVLHEEGRKAQQKSYMWLYRSGRYGPPIVLYEYKQTHAAEHPRAFLAGFVGYLHVDGYQSYEGLPGVILVGCWAHARRGFVEALSVLSPMQRQSVDTAARKGLAYCDKLFAIERDLQDATPEDRHASRQVRSRPVVEEFHAWLVEMQPLVVAKTPTGKAIQYCLNQWDKLTAFLLDGRLELSNNRAERSIKPFVIGRKNWLFANTPRGANASATVYSIVETAKENGINPLTYLTHLFQQLPNTRWTDDNLDQLMPWAEPIQQAHLVTSNNNRR
jgi:transposase